MKRLAAILFLLFIAVSVFVSNGSLRAVDLAATYFFQNTFPRFVDIPFSFFSFLGLAEVTMFFWLILCAYFYFKNRLKVLVALMLLPFGVFLELLGKFYIYQPPPPHSVYRGVFSLDVPSSLSPVEFAYPSGHVLRTAFLVIFLIFMLVNSGKIHKRTYFILLSATLFVMVVSRIYLGEHWTSDVLGGLLLGSSFGIAAGVTVLKSNNS